MPLPEFWYAEKFEDRRAGVRDDAFELLRYAGSR
jgi:hypothetical protein